MRRIGRPRFFHQLHRLFVHADHRTSRIVRLLVGFQDVFHVRDEFGVRLRRDHPVLDLPLRHAVFFSVCRTVSWLIVSTIFQLDDLASQQPQRPVGVALGRRPESHGDDLGLLLAVEKFPSRRAACDWLALQRLLKASLDEPLPNVLHRLGAASKRLGNPPVRPRRAVRVRLQQDLGPTHLLAGPFQLANYFLSTSPVPPRSAARYTSSPWEPSLVRVRFPQVASISAIKATLIFKDDRPLAF